MNEMAVFFHIAHAIVILGLLVMAWLRIRKDAGITVLTMVAMATIGFSLFWLRIFYYSCGDISFPENLIVAFMDAIRYFAMGKGFAEIDELPCDLYIAYYRLEIVLSLLAPMCTATVLYSLLQTVFNRVRLTFSTNCPVCYFSELNERSLTLAKTLNKPDPSQKVKKPKTKIVFCKVSGHSPLQAEAQAMGAVVVDDPIHLINLPDATVRQVRVFLIDDNEENNIQTLLKMQRKLYRKETDVPKTESDKTESGKPAAHAPESDFLVFSTQESAELVYDQVVQGLDKSRLAYDVHLINETRQVAHKLLMDHPLYEAAEACSQDQISLLVVGCGYLGTQILKAAILCGLMDSYRFDVQVIDDQAQQLEQQFLHEHPFLAETSDIFPAKSNPQEPGNPNPKYPALTPVFHSANVCTKAFDDVLKNHCARCNYIVVATGNDQLNVTTAEYLRRWYTQQVLMDPDTKNTSPLIFAAVRSPERHKALKTLENTPGYCGQFHLFANNMDIYSARWVLERPLDTAAAMFNSCYVQSANPYEARTLLNWNETHRRESKKALLRLPIMRQRSNQMTALHSLYKLQDLLHWDANRKGTKAPLLKDCAGEHAVDTFFHLAHLLNLHKADMMDLEHRRWTLFHALCGWKEFKKEHILKLLNSETVPSVQPDDIHKSSVARLHGCMIPTDRLNALSDDLYEATKIRKNFVDNDELMCLVGLFAWLEVSVDPQVADDLLAGLWSQVTIKNADERLLPWICRVGKARKSGQALR